MTLKVNELFSGIGAFRKALLNLNIPHEIVGISEIDKYAIQSYEAMYGKTRNYGDISKINKLDYADMWTYGFPCQDISVAGEQLGIIKGVTRSGLLYEVQRLLTTSKECNELPKFLILENVKNLVGKQFKDKFLQWLDWLDELGYNSYWQVLNAKDYGLPQNRERVFVVSIRKDVDNGSFKMPSPIPLETTMFDFLEDKVDDKYYLSDKYIEYAENLTAEQIESGGGFRFCPVERESNDSENHHNQSRNTSNGQLHQGSYPLNPHDDGTCRTIKAQYANSSFVNFTKTGTFGATGVLKVGGVISKQGKKLEKVTDICSTLLARDYKGFGNQGMTGVIEYEV